MLENRLCKKRPNVMYNFSGFTANSRLKVGSRQKKNTLEESPMVSYNYFNTKR